MNLPSSFPASNLSARHLGSSLDTTMYETASGKPLCNTMISAWCPVMTQRGEMLGVEGGLRGRGHT